MNYKGCNKCQSLGQLKETERIEKSDEDDEDDEETITYKRMCVESPRQVQMPTKSLYAHIVLYVSTYVQWEIFTIYSLTYSLVRYL